MPLWTHHGTASLGGDPGARPAPEATIVEFNLKTTDSQTVVVIVVDSADYLRFSPLQDARYLGLFCDHKVSNDHQFTVTFDDLGRWG